MAKITIPSAAESRKLTKSKEMVLEEQVKHLTAYMLTKIDDQRRSGYFTYTTEFTELLDPVNDMVIEVFESAGYKVDLKYKSSKGSAGPATTFVKFVISWA